MSAAAGAVGYAVGATALMLVAAVLVRGAVRVWRSRRDDPSGPAALRALVMVALAATVVAAAVFGVARAAGVPPPVWMFYAFGAALAVLLCLAVASPVLEWGQRLGDDRYARRAGLPELPRRWPERRVRWCVALLVWISTYVAIAVPLESWNPAIPLSSSTAVILGLALLIGAPTVVAIAVTAAAVRWQLRRIARDLAVYRKRVRDAMGDEDPSADGLHLITLGDRRPGRARYAGGTGPRSTGEGPADVRGNGCRSLRGIGLGVSRR